MASTSIWIWAISILSVLAILTRPGRLPEWAYALLGCFVLLLTGMVPWGAGLSSALKGVDVYFFLIGMMLLSELARTEGLFDWLAESAARHAQGSSRKLFTLIYLAGVVVTVFLSNDATAVVLTPAVYAAVKKAGGKPAPYLFACAFIANAASFVLPISNPANLVVFRGDMPAVLDWVKTFGLPSLLSIAGTFVALVLYFRKELRAPLAPGGVSKELKTNPLGIGAKITAFGLCFMVIVLVTASTLGAELGLPTFLSALCVLIAVACIRREFPKNVLKHVAWGVIPLVAGLFVVLDALSRAGALDLARRFLEFTTRSPVSIGKLLAAFGVGGLTNIANNLPVGLLGGIAVQEPGVSSTIRGAVLLGVDLGPNLSVTGSLATILWLIALRREKESVSGLEFFMLGLIAMPLALTLAVTALR